jgi:hypothetical protein
MNKKLMVLMLIIVSFVFSFPGFAQTKITLVNQPINKIVEKEVPAGILPNSFWYWSDIFAEELRFVGTIGKKNRAAYLMDNARERLAEIKTLSAIGINAYNADLLRDQEKKVEHATRLYIEVGEKLDQKINTDDIVVVSEIKTTPAPQTIFAKIIDKIKKIGATLGDNLQEMFSKTQENVNDKVEQIKEFETSEKRLSE